MNKTELIASVAQKSDLTKKDAEKAVKAVFESISESLTRDDKVQIIGFGTFEVRQRKAREGRNPRNNEPIRIDASKTPAFKAGKQLKDLVNNK
ncbi:DNA-binding protein [Megasphaera cerevisiae DSM 20462]|jgi:DNA-binding protein HU-beta|uniref:DNA-binding protein n=1 Tax=Megasphaera cerevisiae DSM 20462 TaxID=1122219 RepID=A0A0J6X153_9FIRM|nr:HU family DNA-binding protein [Megasphaera cerevisiae]KMO87887.1 DNA-binding protein [Megasphaera cerevisiae DSM 20462]MCI1750107.1 HU family DNA-binding protein [Megasphaera cerevisiae]OKY53676.1 integration host factor subunit alpha [Megasphaera cerevisiae]SJZ42713.1 DNA-binding protein HU-beta [Megasphaera cerevisiae DSM 20462]